MSQRGSFTGVCMPSKLFQKKLVTLLFLLLLIAPPIVSIAGAKSQVVTVWAFTAFAVMVIVVSAKLRELVCLNIPVPSPA